MNNRAADALSYIGDQAAVEPLIKMVQEKAEGSAQAARVLGTLADARAVEPLIGALKSEDPYVRYNAALALGALGDRRAVEPLIAALKDQDEDVRTNAASALGTLKDARAIDALFPLFVVKNQHSCGHGRVFLALANIDDPSVLKHTAKLLEHDDEEIRLKATELTGKISDHEAVPLLIRASEDGSRRVRIAAAKALYTRNHERDTQISRIAAMLKDDSDNVRLQAARALITCKAPQSVDALVAALKDRDGNVRHAAAEALGFIKDARAVDALIDLVYDPWDLVACEAAYSLGQIGDPRGYEPLIDILQPGKYPFNETAAQALGDLGDRRAVEHLKRCYPTIWVRYALCMLDYKRKEQLRWLTRFTARPSRVGHALAHICDPTTVRALIISLKYLDGCVKEEAIDALEKLTGQDLGPHAWRWWQWWHRNKAAFQKE